MSKPRFALSTGDPGGVGPTVSVQAAARYCDRAKFSLFGQRQQLEPLLSRHGLEAVSAPSGSGRSVVVIDVTQDKQSLVLQPTPTAAGGKVQLAALERAVDAVVAGQCDALVTAPMSKQAVNLAGVSFTGHTEYLAKRSGQALDAVTMIFSGPRLSVSLVTTHVPIRALSERITAGRVIRAGEHLENFLHARARQSGKLRIVVCGLNPHAGEGGILGDEEERVVRPALGVLKTRLPSVDWRGPVGAETAFRWAAAGEVDGVVAQFHDQATVPSKLLDWGQAVNVTWGLPFLRVSVDHGVAYDSAVAGTADPSGMCAAVELALRFELPLRSEFA